MDGVGLLLGTAAIAAGAFWLDVLRVRLRP